EIMAPLFPGVNWRAEDGRAGRHPQLRGQTRRDDAATICPRNCAVRIRSAGSAVTAFAPVLLPIRTCAVASPSFSSVRLQLDSQHFSHAGEVAAIGYVGGAVGTNDDARGVLEPRRDRRPRAVR